MKTNYIISALFIIGFGRIAMGDSVGIDSTLASDQSVSVGVSAGMALTERTALDAQVSLNKHEGGDTYSVRLGVSFPLAETLRAGLSLVGTIGGQSLPAFGGGVELAWSLTEQTVFIPSVQLVRHGGRHSYALQQAYGARVEQGVGLGLTLLGGYTQYLYWDGSVDFAPGTWGLPRSSRLTAFVNGAPESVALGGVGLSILDRWDVSIQLSSTAFASGRLASGDATLVYSATDFFVGLLGGATETTTAPLTYAGITTGLKW